MWRFVYGRLLPFLMSGFLFVGGTPSKTFAQQGPPTLTVQQIGELRPVVDRVLQRANKADCKKGKCTILVTNFTSSDGSTSRLGMELADVVSGQLAAAAVGIQVVDRKRLYEYLEKERIPSKELGEENAARWLAIEQSANAALVGRLDDDGDKLIVTIQLLDAHHLVSNPKDHPDALKGPEEKVALTVAEADGQLKPAEPFNSTPHQPSAEGEATVRAGTHGTTVPTGLYMPTPNYTDSARTARFQGTIVLLVTVCEEGSAMNPRILNGLPFGLNQTALNAVRAWKFRPATLEGKAVSTQVPIEVTYRLF